MLLRQLKYFASVATKGSITAAAAELHVSQPALGTQIKKLEEELGVELLLRTHHGVTLTQAGERFLKHTTDILDRVKFAERDLSRFKGRIEGEVNLGVTPSSGRVLLPSIIDECSILYPEISIACKQGYSDEMINAVKRGELDLAFSHEPGKDDNLTATPVLAQELCLIGPIDLVKPDGAPISFQELSDYPLIQERKTHSTRSLLEEIAARLDMTLDIFMDADPIYLRKQMMDIHHRCTVSLYGLFYDEILAGHLAARPIDAPEMTRILYIIRKGGETMRPADRVVLEIIEKQVAAKISDGLYHWQEPGWRPDRKNKLQSVS